MIREEGSNIFRPKARLIKTIGEELISNEVVAVVELVKNSYDADADLITISFEGKVESIDGVEMLSRNNSRIIISDDGCGMSLAVIQKAWMEPATSFKKINSKSKSKERKLTGEKGIGRFASAKLGKKLRIISKESSDLEVVADFDWSAFYDNDLYLDEIKSRWFTRDSEYISSKSGTILIIEELNQDWTIDDFNELSISLSRLINPVSPILDFLIELKLPSGFQENSVIISSPTTLERPNYKVKGHLDNNGNFHLDIFSDISNTQRNIYLNSMDVFKDKPLLGPFKFEFRVWNRDNISSTFKNVKEDLDKICGISIYRDNFRVLPYGESQNDWLRLDLRRVNNPTLRLSNNQILGYLSFSSADNPDLKDQTNREGLVKSTAFKELEIATKNILNELEQFRYIERRATPGNKASLSSRKNIYELFSLEPLLKYVAENKNVAQDFKDIVKETEINIQKGVKTVTEVVSRYRRLSSLSLLVDSIIHDSSQILTVLDASAYNQKKLIQKLLPSENELIIEILDKNSKIINEKDALKAFISRLTPFSGRKRSQNTDVSIEDCINNVVSIYKEKLKQLGITVSLDLINTKISGDLGSLQSVFINLFENSIFFLGNINDPKILIVVKSIDNFVECYFSDNGPGIKPEIVDHVFDPYFSTKPDGVGLGLTIVGEIISELHGFLELIENEGGTTFKITLPK